MTYRSHGDEARLIDVLMVAGIVYGASFLIVLASMVVWAVRGRKKTRMLLTQSVFAVVFGVWGVIVTVSAPAA